ncbi:quinon protein alcohol dehydrogenase-like superfamily [Limtongia smithiae]|uniref:quinon protein alcohol dehydrogenase-like superfamily n=1 Tax=Limtongia smithiae TaxID=1125753 RepID=UPI0034CF22F5
MPPLDPDAFQLALGYPAYATAFATQRHLVVAGGGGEGKNGVANKISVLDVDPTTKDITVLAEKILAKDEDSPTSLAVSPSGVIAAGINIGTAALKSGSVNDHLRLFTLESDNRIEAHSRQSVFEPEDTTPLADVFQKTTRFSPRGKYLAISSSDGVLHVLAYPSLEPMFPAVATYNEADDTRRIEIQDVDFSPDEKVLVYATSTAVVLLDATDGRVLSSHYPPPASNFRGVRYVAPDMLVLVANHARRKGASLLKLTLPPTAVITAARASRGLHRGIAAATAFDARGTLAAVAGADLSVSLVSVSTLQELKVVRNAHDFAITGIALNASCTAMASVSVAQTVTVVGVSASVIAAAQRSSSWDMLQVFYMLVFMGILIAAVALQSWVVNTLAPVEEQQG